MIRRGREELPFEIRYRLAWDGKLICGPEFDLTGHGKVNLFDFFLFADASGSSELAKLLAVVEEYLGVPLVAQLA